MNAASAESSPAPKPPGFFRRSLFFWISVAAHALLIAIATALVVQNVVFKKKTVFEGKSGPPVVSSRSLEYKVAAPQASSSSAPAMAKRITAKGASRITLPEMPAMPDVAEVVPATMPGLGGAGLGMGFGTGVGAGGGGGGGGGGTLQLFGMRTVARTVVIVLDISGSMAEGAEKRESYGRLERELSQLIKSLSSDTQFGLVAFSRAATPFNPELVKASESEKAKSIRWLRGMSPMRAFDKGAKGANWGNFAGGRHTGTRADLGLRAAFDLKPDMIFFICDGDPTDRSGPQILKDVQEWQTELARPAPINTIAYVAGGGLQFMKDLAGQNNGKFEEIKAK